MLFSIPTLHGQFYLFLFLNTLLNIEEKYPILINLISYQGLKL